MRHDVRWQLEALPAAGEDAEVSHPTTIVVIHRNRSHLLAGTIDALVAQTVPVRILLVDSGSTDDEHRAALDLLPPGSDVVRMGRNGGFGPSANAGWRRFLDGAAGHVGDVVGLCPHDALPAPDTVERILRELAARPRAGFACADYGDGVTPVIDPYFGAIDRPATVEEGWEPADYPHGTMLFARAAALEDVGLFDERYFAYCEESDLGIRARAAGWEVGLVRGARVVNPSMSNALPVVDYLMVRNTLLLVRSHSGRYKAFIRTCIAVAQLWTERESSPYHDVRARIRAILDFCRGRFGPPPDALVADAARRAPADPGSPVVAPT